MRVPGHIVDGKGSPFPQGIFVGRLAEVKDEWTEDNSGLEYILTLRDNTPVSDNVSNVGARPFTQRVTVIFKGQSIVDLQEFGEKTPFALQRAVTTVSQLAIALGYTTRAADGSVDFNTEEFLENLLSGAYKDRQVGFEVTHRNWKSKTQKNSDGTAKTGISAEAGRFFDPNASAPAPVTEAADLREVRTRA